MRPQGYIQPARCFVRHTSAFPSVGHPGRIIATSFGQQFGCIYNVLNSTEGSRQFRRSACKMKNEKMNVLLSDWSSWLRFNGKFRNIIGRSNSLKAALTVNLYTKKQNKFHFVKSVNRANFWLWAVCPAMSKYVRLCPKNGDEFLTFRHAIFFTARPTSAPAPS